MRRILHVRTSTSADLARQVAQSQKDNPEVDIRVVELTDSEPDYAALVREIFQADAIHVW